MLSIRTYLIGLLIFFSLISRSYTHNYTQFKLGEDIDCNQIYEIFEDDNGYLWLGTNNGIIRYDGNEFLSLSNEKGLGLIDAYNIGALNNGTLWARSLNEILFFDPVYFKKKNASIKINNTSRNFNISNLVQEPNGTIIITTFNAGTYKLVGQQFIKSDEFSQELTIEALNDHTSIRFAGKELLNQDSKSAIGAALFQNNKVRLNDSIYFISANKYLFQLDTKKNALSVYKEFDNVIVNMNKTRDNELLVVMDYGYIWKINKYTNELEILFDDLKRPTAIVHSYEGGYWISTINNGIFYLPNLEVKSILDEEIHDVPIKKVIANDHFLFIGTRQSYIAKYDHKKVEKMAFQDALFRDFIFNKNKELISMTYHNGIKNLSTNKRISNFAGRRILYNSKDVLYCIGMYLSKYQTNEKPLQLVNDIFDAWSCQIKNDTILICASKSPVFYSTETNDIIDIGELYPVLNRKIKSCHWKGDTILYNSEKEGFFVQTKDTIIQINTEVGLISNKIYNSFIDSEGTIWACSNKGVSRIKNVLNSEKRSITNLTIADGLNSNEVMNGCEFHDSIYIATSLGVNYFHKDVLINSSKPKLFLDSVTINKSFVPIKPTYSLDYNENLVRIDFHALSMKTRLPIKYHYRILPNDTNWVTSANSFIIMNGLSPGMYTVEICASNNSESIVSPTHKLTFIISSPFYQKNYFVVLVIIGASLLIYVFVKIRFNRLKRQQELSDQLNTIKQQALAAQMNPHFIFNSLNSIQKFLLTNDRKNANKYLTTFSTLMRRVLQNSNKQLISLEHEMETLTIYITLEQLRFKEKLAYEISYEKTIDLTDYQIPPMLLQPFVENAIWHGIMHKKEGKGKLKITISQKEDHLFCCIEDNGIGREEALKIKSKNSTLRKSFGMNITQQRMALIEKLFVKKFHCETIDLKDHNLKAIGTRVEIKIPKI